MRNVKPKRTLPVVAASFGLACLLWVGPSLQSDAQTPPEIPEVLQPWKSWVLWDDPNVECLAVHGQPGQTICFWPLSLDLTAGDDGGSFTLEVEALRETWVPLPGSASTWPTGVTDRGEPAAVIGFDGQPRVKLAVGRHVIAGKFRWDAIPQRLTIPPQIGLLRLRVGDEAIAMPRWDTGGDVWLRRDTAASDEADAIGVQVYRVIEDGIPLQLRTQIELTVSGKSREVTLGSALPRGWTLATVQSPVPVAVDDAGRVRVQVRAGKWNIQLHAFRTDNESRVQFADAAEPIVPTELIALQADPTFRVAAIEGIPLVDVTQTTFPEKWRGLPVHLWRTDAPFELREQMRGAGVRSVEGLEINRQFWLDDDGGGLTYRDAVSGKSQRRWRLDAAGGQLGAVRIGDEGQLITANPATGAAGVEIRRRDFNLTAVGRTERIDQIDATGWLADARSLRWTLNLPPGWRALAVWGPDDVHGDWLTAWSLLDLFLLLIFSLSVRRLFGWTAGAVALLAFAIAYHEPGSPRWTWVLLLIPIALCRVIPAGRLQRGVMIFKTIAVVLLLIFLVPFLAGQAQNILYPQLEPSGYVYGNDDIFRIGSSRSYQTVATVSMDAAMPADIGNERFERDFEQSLSSGDLSYGRVSKANNMAYDAKSRIQTGPAIPQWDWNSVTCRWDGPVAAGQRVTPVLLSMTGNRILTAVRLGLLLLLATILLRRPGRWPRWRAGASAAASVVMLVGRWHDRGRSNPRRGDPVPASRAVDPARPAIAARRGNRIGDSAD